jgi:hypothetical protein
MTEQVPENDFGHNVQDMTPEANADMSRGHLLRWAMDHGLFHIIDGKIVINEVATEEKEVAEEDPLTAQNTVSLDEAGEHRRKLRWWPRAS